MKQMATLLLLLALAAGFALADQWTGWITDDKCAATGKFTGAEHKKCLEAGAKMVFVNEADKKMYVLADQEKAKDHVGQKVTLEGTAQGDSIQVQNITPASR